MVMPLAAEILLPLPLPAFTFLVPFGSEPGPVGGRVVVPWQGSLRIGICSAVSDVGVGRCLDLRELVSWLDARPFFTPGAIGLFSELAERTAHPAGSVLASFALTGLNEELLHEVKLQRESELAPDVAAGEWQPVGHFSSDQLERLRQEGLVVERAGIRPRVESRLVATGADASGLKSAPKQQQALAGLLAA